MLESGKISELATDVVHAQRVHAYLERVLTTPAIDSEGKEALRITLVLNPLSAKSLTGDEALDLLVAIQVRLLEAGEDRLPIIEYATEADLLEDETEQSEEQGEDDT